MRAAVVCIRCNLLASMQENNAAVRNTHVHVERNGSGVELRIIDYEKPVSNPVLRC